MPAFMKIIDAHAHCGRLDRFPPQDLRDYTSYLGGSGITAAIMFPPVAEIYDRSDPNFKDTGGWRSKRAESNEYLLGIGSSRFEVYPFFFMWNDFAIEQLSEAHKGIKWHRHSDEPVYDYANPRCAAAVAEIRRRNMPVVLEEEFENTLFFINELAEGVRVIIPHLGMLNGGYELLRRNGIWEKPNIYSDTALASPGEIKDYVLHHGHERIQFGSDFPFGDPASELSKVLRLNLPDDQRDAIIGLNAAKLLSEVL
jgi:hypothetical protein